MKKEINIDLFIEKLKNGIFKDCIIEFKVRKDGTIDCIRITRNYYDLEFTKELEKND